MSMSNYLATALLNHVYRNTALTSPTTVYVALYTAAPTDAGGGTECSGTDYERIAATFGAPSGSPLEIANSSEVSFGTDSDGSFGTLTHFGLFDAETSGNLLDWGALTTSKTPAAGDPVRFATGELTLNLQ